jgi:alpha-beta hydrolase superfamily lysophospholipase
MQLAGTDSVVCAEAAQLWFKNIDKNKVDATIKIYPGFLHEIYNETQRHEAISDFIGWFNQRV